MVKNLPANTGDMGLIPGLGRSPGGGNGNPLQYSCLGNPMDRGSCWAAVHGITKESNNSLLSKQHANFYAGAVINPDCQKIFLVFFKEKKGM